MAKIKKNKKSRGKPPGFTKKPDNISSETTKKSNSNSPGSPKDGDSGGSADSTSASRYNENSESTMKSKLSPTAPRSTESGQRVPDDTAAAPTVENLEDIQEEPLNKKPGTSYGAISQSAKTSEDGKDTKQDEEQSFFEREIPYWFIETVAAVALVRFIYYCAKGCLVGIQLCQKYIGDMDGVLNRSHERFELPSCRNVSLSDLYPDVQSALNVTNPTSLCSEQNNLRNSILYSAKEEPGWECSQDFTQKLIFSCEEAQKTASDAQGRMRSYHGAAAKSLLLCLAIILLTGRTRKTCVFWVLTAIIGLVQCLLLVFPYFFGTRTDFKAQIAYTSLNEYTSFTMFWFSLIGTIGFSKRGGSVRDRVKMLWFSLISAIRYFRESSVEEDTTGNFTSPEYGEPLDLDLDEQAMEDDGRYLEVSKLPKACSNVSTTN